MTTTTTMMRRLAVAAMAVWVAACGQKPVTLQRVELSPPVQQLPVGLASGLTVTAIYSDGSKQRVTSEATWSVSDAAVASVDAALVTGVAKGVATVTARWSGREATAQLTIIDAVVVRLDMTAEAASLPKGSSIGLQAFGLFSDGAVREVTGSATWSCEGGAISFPEPGRAHGAAVGHGDVLAAIGDVKAMVGLDVTDAAVTSVRLVSQASRLPVGVATKISALASYTDGQELDVTADAEILSTDETVLTIDADHTLRAVGTGDAWVRAAFANHVAESRVAVTPAEIISLRIAPDVATVLSGAATKFQAFGTFTDGGELEVTDLVTWSAPEVAVASLVNAAGEAGAAYGLAAGDATVTATVAASGLTATARLTVLRPALVSIALSDKKIDLGIGESYQVVATGTFSDGSTDDVSAQLTWVVAGLPGVADVNGGLITATGPGKTTVLAYDPEDMSRYGYVGVTVR